MSGIWRASAHALVLAPGVIPLSMVFGVAAAAAGFTAAQVVVMSVFGFAGTAQFAAVGLASGGAGALAVAGIVFVINSRYLLMTTAMLQMAGQAQARPWQRWLLSLLVVDESFALQTDWTERQEGRARAGQLLAIGGTLMVIWTAGSLAGAAVGARLPDLARFGLDYALPGLFVGLLGIFAKDREHAVVGVAALAVAALATLAGFGLWAAILFPPVLALGWGHLRRRQEEEQP
ncbi:MAG: AzlC family ABC transporter permease [Thermoplasmatota archaeon]